MYTSPFEFIVTVTSVPISVVISDCLIAFLTLHYLLLRDVIKCLLVGISFNKALTVPAGKLPNEIVCWSKNCKWSRS